MADADHALQRARDIMLELCEIGGAAAGKLLRLPGMKALFMWLLSKMAMKMFGPSCGFAYENFQASKKLLKMDMTACPYCRYAKKLNCPELMPIFCDSDFATYGNLPGIRFERTQTIGTGGNCTALDVNQFQATAIVHLENAEKYRFANNGRKCKLITRQNGEPVELTENEAAANRISTSGIFSELIVELDG